MTQFQKLGLKKNVLEALEALKFKEPLEVQSKIIPLTLKGKNVVFTSRTGSGKTLAYSVGALGKLNPKMGVQMVVLTPTRELCVQVGKELTKFCDLLNLQVGVLYGGRDLSGDYRTIHRKNQIIVATPGRFVDHVNNKTLKIGEVVHLVYDEADQMFDHGFFDTCEYLMTRVSKKSQIILASATLNSKVKQFIKRFNHELVEIGELIPKNISQEVIFCHADDKMQITLQSLELDHFKRAIVFVNTKAKAFDVAEFLAKHYKCKELTGNLDQSTRKNMIDLFRAGKIQVLVTTDVAARGIHVDGLDIVINFDVPTRDEFYVHRIGRTGRTDKEGYALTLICEEDEERFLAIENKYDLHYEVIE